MTGEESGGGSSKTSVIGAEPQCQTKRPAKSSASGLGKQKAGKKMEKGKEKTEGKKKKRYY
jgi:hypothetical protein